MTTYSIFLDVTVILHEHFIMFYRYSKSTSLDRYLSFYSNYPIGHKKGVVYGMMDRILLLSHPQFHQKNFENIISILLDNGYLLVFIFSIIRQRLKFHCYPHPNTKLLNKNRKYFTIPFVKFIFESFMPVTLGIHLTAFTISNTLKKFIITQGQGSFR